MANLDSQSARAKLQQYLEPGEELLHAAYGVRPPSVLTIVLLAVFTAGVGAVVAAQLMAAHYVVGVTRSRLLLLRVRAFSFTPIECASSPLNRLTRVRTQAGPIFVRLEFSDQRTERVLKFHRAAFSGNREAALAIGQALQAGAFASDPGTHHAPTRGVAHVGAAVTVRWADGALYPAELAAVTGDQYLCRFPNGTESWVGAAFVRLVNQPPAASAVALSAALVPPEPGSPPKGLHHLFMGCVIGALTVVVGVGLTFYGFLMAGAPLNELLSEGGILSLSWLLVLVVKCVGAGAVAALLSLLFWRASPLARGALIGGISYLAGVVFAGAVLSILDGGVHFIERTIGALVGIVTQPSAITFVVWIAYVTVGAVAVRLLETQTAEATAPRFA